MKLEGKALEDFRVWLKDNEPVKGFMDTLCLLAMGNFHYLPESLQWGVLIDFFESKHIHITVGGEYNIYSDRFDFSWGIQTYTDTGAEVFVCEDNLIFHSEARKEALENANSLYNEMYVD